MTQDGTQGPFRWILHNLDLMLQQLLMLSSLPLLQQLLMLLLSLLMMVRPDVSNRTLHISRSMGFDEKRLKRMNPKDSSSTPVS